MATLISRVLSSSDLRLASFYFSAFLSDFCAYLLSLSSLTIISIKFVGGFALPRTLLSQKLITNTSSPRSPLPTRLKSHKHEPPMNFDHDSFVITIDDDSPDLSYTASVQRPTTKIHSPVVPGSRQCTGSAEKSQQRPDLRSLATVTRHFMHRIPHRSFVDGENWVCAGGLRQYLVATIPATVASMFITQWSRMVHWGARHFQPKSVAAGVCNGGGHCWGLSGNVNLAHPFSAACAFDPTRGY